MDEYKIGEIIKTKDKYFECIEGDDCESCIFENSKDICNALTCGEDFRKDKTSVIFKEVKSVIKMNCNKCGFIWHLKELDKYGEYCPFCNKKVD